MPLASSQRSSHWQGHFFWKSLILKPSFKRPSTYEFKTVFKLFLSPPQAEINNFQNFNFFSCFVDIFGGRTISFFLNYFLKSHFLTKNGPISSLFSLKQVPRASLLTIITFLTNFLSFKTTVTAKALFINKFHDQQPAAGLPVRSQDLVLTIYHILSPTLYSFHHTQIVINLSAYLR